MLLNISGIQSLKIMVNVRFSVQVLGEVRVKFKLHPTFNRTIPRGDSMISTCDVAQLTRGQRLCDRYGGQNH